MCSRTLGTVVCVVIFCAVAMHGQDMSQITSIPVGPLTLDVHGFAQQGFAYSNNNNYLTMMTSDGSFKMSDGGVNVSTRLTEKLRAGAQAYDRYLGNLDKGQLQLDWALLDYRFTSWFGMRGGRVKTTLGLFNDTQDMEFLYTFALLPQSMYPQDQRSNTIAHVGGDLYGNIPLRRLGSLSYTVYGGRRPNAPREGFIHAMNGIGTTVISWEGWMDGEDVRWETPLKGVTAGFSYMDQNPGGRGTAFKAGDPGVAIEQQIPEKDQTYQYYLQYTHGKLELDAEYRRHYRIVTVIDDYPVIGRISFKPEADSRSWYVMASYRVSKHFAAGAYSSEYFSDWRRDLSSTDNHIYDQVFSARFDFNSHWNFKVEGHIMDGVGAMDAARGFYPEENPGNAPVHIGAGGLVVPTGLRPTTNMLVMRAGFAF